MDGVTLKDTNGVNDVASIAPKQVTENEARLTGFNTSKYWFNFGIPNQTLKVPYADMAIRALSFGKEAIPADTGMVRNVEGISDSIMNDPLFSVGYITRSGTSPYSPVNGREFHIMYFPSTQAYGTQMAVTEQSFNGKVNSNSGRGFAVYMRSGQERLSISSPQINTYKNKGYTVTTDPLDSSKYIASDWSDWIRINTSSQIYQQAFSVSNSSTNKSLSFSEKNLDTVIKDIYQRILGLNYYNVSSTENKKSP